MQPIGVPVLPFRGTRESYHAIESWQRIIYFGVGYGLPFPDLAHMDYRV